MDIKNHHEQRDLPEFGIEVFKVIEEHSKDLIKINPIETLFEGSFIKQYVCKNIDFKSRKIIDPFYFLPVDVSSGNLEQSIR